MPIRGHQSLSGASLPSGNISHHKRCPTSAGVSGQGSGSGLCRGNQSLRVVSAPVCEVPVPIRGLGPRQGYQSLGCQSQAGYRSGWGQPRVIHANCSPGAINRCDKQQALAAGDIMKVWVCNRRTDNNAIGNYRAAPYWISAVRNELRLAGHASPLLECLLLLSFVIVSGSSGGWMRGGHVSSPHLFCITMQPSPPAADPECQCPPPKWTKKTVKTQFT